jgi:hypothetical protein
MGKREDPSAKVAWITMALWLALMLFAWWLS